MIIQTPDVPREINGDLWSSLISPRPLFLISTYDETGTINIAPFSSVSLLSTYPPIIGFSISKRKRIEKRTELNVRRSLDLVINLVPRFLADQMVQAAQQSDLTDDFKRLGLSETPGHKPQNHLILECPASIECVVDQIVGLAPSSATLFIVRPVTIRIRDEFCTTDGSFDTMSADLLASVGTETYISLNGDIITLPKTWD